MVDEKYPLEGKEKEYLACTWHRVVDIDVLIAQLGLLQGCLKNKELVGIEPEWLKEAGSGAVGHAQYALGLARDRSLGARLWLVEFCGRMDRIREKEGVKP